MFNYKTIRTQTNTTIGGTGAHTVLGTVNVNTGAASAILTIYDGQTASAPSVLLATVDASSKSSQFFGIRAANGLYVALAGGNADVTIGYA